MSMPIVRVYTGDDGESHFEDTEVPLTAKDAANGVSELMASHEVQFQETVSGGSFDWHNAPRRQYVITLSGELLFESRNGETHTLVPGQVLLAEDVDGGGHRWKLTNDQPWRRLYVHLGPAK
jgi:hypothetical protein